jgi:uroporphyrin-III C-methyltransferase/precorrin-2 dehydrogenase/sirohydrochlorin ferrochelatase
MGLTGLDTICREMVNHGLAPTTPAALIQQGTTVNQKVISGTLDTLAETVFAAKVKAPTLLIIGSVVRLHDQLAWFSPETATHEGSVIDTPTREPSDGL